MTVWTRTRLAAALALVAALAVVPAARAEVLVGVDDAATQSIFTFDAAAPGTLLFATAITGLGVNDQIVGIDYRAADGELYALVRDLVANTTSLWAIHGANAVRVTPLAAFSAANAGLDFNAVVDRARAVDTDAVSARFNPTGSAEVIDSAVAYPAAGDPNSGQAPAVGAVAYGNPFPGATSTTLFDLDAATDDLAIQNPANAGVLNTVGSTGVDFSADVGFDIGASGAAFASVHTGGATSSLASVNLATGQLSNLTQIGGGGFTAPNIAVVPSGVLVIEDVAVAEGEGTAFVTVARRAGSVGTIGVSYATADGTAAAGLDYTAASGALTFAPGETEKVVSVPISGDAVPESSETLTVNLSSPTGGATIGDAQGIVAILDQTGSGPQGRPPTVRITAPAAGVGFAAPGTIVVAADASDDGGVARVVFLHDGLVIGEDREAPYTASFTPGGEDVGPAEVSAMAFDGGGQTASDTVGFTVERFRRARLSLSARRRGRTVTATGALDPPDGVTSEQACSGVVVTLAYRRGRRTVASPLAVLDSRCRYRARTRLRSVRGVTVQARYPGNAVVRAVRSPSRRLR